MQERPFAPVQGVVSIMAQKDFSSRIGSSPSPSINRVIKNNENVQQPCPSVKQALADKHTNSPVKK